MSGGKWKEKQNFLAAAAFLAQLFSYTLCISYSLCCALTLSPNNKATK